MLYAILAYHVEDMVASWTPEEDAALMTDLHKVHDRLTQDGQLGPAARLGATQRAFTLRGPGAGVVVDGPFAETKEQLLGFYIVDCATSAAAIAAARPAPRQSHRRLRNPSRFALSARRAVSDDRKRRRDVPPGWGDRSYAAGMLNVKHVR